MDERWLEIHGFEGFYKVSDLGQVASLPRPGGDGRRKRKGRILSQHGEQPYVDFMVDGEKSRHLVSRLVASTFIREIQKGEVVAHLDLNKKNNSASNLGIMSHKEMMSLTNAILCDYEYVDRSNMTREKVREYLDYSEGNLFWRKRPALSVKVGTKAGFICGARLSVHLCGNTYQQSHLVYLYHHGRSPEYVLPRNGDFSDCRVDNLYEATASQYATISGRINNVFTASVSPSTSSPPPPGERL